MLPYQGLPRTMLGRPPRGLSFPSPVEQVPFLGAPKSVSGIVHSCRQDKAPMRGDNYYQKKPRAESVSICQNKRAFLGWQRSLKVQTNGGRFFLFHPPLIFSKEGFSDYVESQGPSSSPSDPSRWPKVSHRGDGPNVLLGRGHLVGERTRIPPVSNPAASLSNPARQTLQGGSVGIGEGDGASPGKIEKQTRILCAQILRRRRRHRWAPDP